MSQITKKIVGEYIVYQHIKSNSRISFVNHDGNIYTDSSYVDLGNDDSNEDKSFLIKMFGLFLVDVFNDLYTNDITKYITDIEKNKWETKYKDILGDIDVETVETNIYDGIEYLGMKFNVLDGSKIFFTFCDFAT